mgnify:CR=1 FL=1
MLPLFGNLCRLGGGACGGAHFLTEATRIGFDPDWRNGFHVEPCCERERLFMLEHASFTAPFQQYFHYAQLSRKLSNWPEPSKILQKQLKRISDF